MTQIFLGLGSNHERELHLHAALDALSEFVSQISCSPVFESHAVGVVGGNFYNCVVTGKTDLPLAELDKRLKCIEADNGRYAPNRQGLPLDIDVLLYDDWVGNYDGLQLPRAEILKNAFVLWPLSLLAPELMHPLAKQPFAKLWADAQIDQQLWPVAFTWRGQDLTPQELLAGA